MYGWEDIGVACGKDPCSCGDPASAVSSRRDPVEVKGAQQESLVQDPHL